MARQVQIIVRDSIFASPAVTISINIRLKNDLLPVLRLNGFQTLSNTTILGLYWSNLQRLFELNYVTL